MMNKQRCQLCSRNHPLKYCKTFWIMNLEKRREFVKKMEYCLNCFAETHNRYWCESPNRCNICGAKHHTMIHLSPHEANTSSSSFEDDEKPHSNVEECVKSRPVLNSTYIPPLIRISMKYRERSLCLTFLLDKSCDQSFILRHVANRYHNVYSSNVFENGDYGIFEVTPTYPAAKQKKTMHLQLMVRSHITFTLSEAVRDPLIREHFNELTPLAHPEFARCRKVDGVLGTDNFQKILRKKIHHPHQGVPRAQETVFGWVIYGNWNGCNCKVHSRPGGC